MKLDKVVDISKFSSLYKNKSTTIKLLVDSDTICVNEAILACWSTEYKNFMEEENEIFLLEFGGCSTEVDECVALLHGLEVKVHFGSIIAIAKFAEKFKIRDLIIEVDWWFRSNLSVENLKEMINVLSKMYEMSLSVLTVTINNRLIDCIRRFLSENMDECIPIISNSNKISTFLLEILLKKDDLLKTYVPVITSKIVEESQCMLLVKKLEELTKYHLDIVLNNEEHIKKLFDRILDVVENPAVLKSSLKLILGTYLGVSSSLTPPNKTLDFQSWREFTKGEIEKLHKRKDITEYEYCVIVVDWIEHTEPSKAIAEKLFKGIRVDQLSSKFEEEDLKSCLRSYRYITGCDDEVTYDEDNYKVFKYEYQTWHLDSKQLIQCIDNNKQVLKLSSYCTLSNCKPDPTACNVNDHIHVVYIRFNRFGDRLQIETLNTPNNKLGDNQRHTHCGSYQYLNWYFQNISATALFLPLYPLYTNSCSEIVKFMKADPRDHREISITCFMSEINH